MKITTILPFILVAGCALSLHAGSPAEAGSAKSSKMVNLPPAVPHSWKDDTISPVADIIFFEDPIVHSEITPVFMYHDIDNAFPLTQGGHSEIYGARVQFAVTPHLGIFLNKGGYMDIHPKAGPEIGGWADTGFGFKYMAIDDEANQFVLTPGIGYAPPWGDKTILFGNGNGEWNFFTSAEKGFGKFHLMARVGLRLPNDTDANSTIFHYGVQMDYHVCRYFIPFISGVGYTVVDAGNHLPINSEGADSQNFGSSLSQGNTQFLLGIGFRSKITETIDVGVAYQKGVVKPYGTFDDRVTVAVQFKF